MGILQCHSSTTYECICARPKFEACTLHLTRARSTLRCAAQGQHDVPFAEGESRVSGTLYLCGQEHCGLLNEVYARFSHTNPMHSDVFPSVRQMELEVLAMTASMVGGVHVLPPSCLLCMLPNECSQQGFLRSSLCLKAGLRHALKVTWMDLHSTPSLNCVLSAW